MEKAECENCKTKQGKDKVTTHECETNVEIGETIIFRMQRNYYDQHEKRTGEIKDKVGFEESYSVKKMKQMLGASRSEEDEEKYIFRLTALAEHWGVDGERTLRHILQG